jgi:hypothetical protein
MKETANCPGPTGCVLYEYLELPHGQCTNKRGVTRDSFNFVSRSQLLSRGDFLRVICLREHTRESNVSELG